MPKLENLYEKFKINSDATDAQIGAVFKKLAVKYNPDTSKDKNAEEKLRRINEIYEILTTPNKRAEHDSRHGFSDTNVYNYAEAKAAKAGGKTIIIATAVTPKTKAAAKTVVVPKTSSDSFLPEEMERALIEAELAIIDDELALAKMEEGEAKVLLAAKIAATNKTIKAIKKQQRDAKKAATSGDSIVKTTAKKASASKTQGTVKTKDGSVKTKAATEGAVKTTAKKDDAVKAKANKNFSNALSVDGNEAAIKKAKAPSKKKVAKAEAKGKRLVRARAATYIVREKLRGVYTTKKPARNSPINIFVQPHAPSAFGTTASPSVKTMAGDLGLDNIPITMETSFEPAKDIYPATVGIAHKAHEYSATSEAATTLDNSGVAMMRPESAPVKSEKEIAKKQKNRKGLKIMLVAAVVLGIFFLLYGVLASVAVSSNNPEFMGGVFAFLFTPSDTTSTTPDPTPELFTVTFVAGSGGVIRGVSVQEVELNSNTEYVFAEANTGYRFISWSNGVMTPFLRVSNISAAMTITATFEVVLPNTYAPTPVPTFTLTTSTVGAGTVFGTGATNTIELYESSGIYLFAVPAPNYRFVRFVVTRGTLGAQNVLSPAFRLDNIQADTSVQAMFELIPLDPGVEPPVYFNIEISLDPISLTGGSIEIDGELALVGADGTISLPPMRAGTVLIVRAIPLSGFEFIGWGNGASGAFMPLTAPDPLKRIVVGEAISLNPTFSAIMAEFIIGSGTGGLVQRGTGTPANELDFSFWINYTDAQNVTAVPNAGHHFVRWSDFYPNATRNVTALRASVTAIFAQDAPIPFIITFGVNFDDRGSLVNGGSQYLLAGQNGTTVTAMPASQQFRFSHWTKNGTVIENSTQQLTVANITADADFVAVFIVLYRVTFSILNGQGSLVGSTVQYVAFGERVTPVTAVALVDGDVRYIFNHWRQNGGAFDFDGDMYATINPVITAANRFFEATFFRLHRMTFVREGAGGLINGETEQWLYAAQESTQVTALLAANYRFVEWSWTSNGVQLTSPHAATTFAMGSPAVDTVITAHFVRFYQVIIHRSPQIGGDIIGSQLQIIDANAIFMQSSVTAIAREAYQFVGWSFSSIFDQDTIIEINPLLNSLNGYVLSDFAVNYRVDIFAHFVMRQVEITVNVQSGGSIGFSTAEFFETTQTAIRNFGHGPFALWAQPISNNYEFVGFYVQRLGTSFMASADRVDNIYRRYRMQLNSSDLLVNNLTITAMFAPVSHTVQFVVYGNNGLFTGGYISGLITQSVIHNTNAAVVTAVPFDGFRFIGWRAVNAGSDFIIATPYFTPTITQAAVFEAVFVRVQLTITFVASSGGTVSGAFVVGGNGQLVYWGQASASAVTATTNTGYRFVNWTWTIGSDSFSYAGAVFAPTNIRQDITFTAVFERIQLSLAFSVQGGGILYVGDETSPQDSNAVNVTVYYGSDWYTIRACPNAGYYFANWSDGYLGLTRTNIKVTSDLSLVAIFRPYILLTFEVNQFGSFVGTAGYELDWAQVGRSGRYFVRQARLNSPILPLPLAVAPNTGATFSHWAIADTGNQLQQHLGATDLFDLLQLMHGVNGANFYSAHRPLTFRAVFIQGNGAVGTPFGVINFETLQAINRFYSSNFAIQSHIDLAAYNFTPLAPNGFRGSLVNNGGFIISNTTISKAEWCEYSDRFFSGFFAKITGVAGAEVSIAGLIFNNIIFNLAHINPSYNLYVGGLVGRIVSTTLPPIRLVNNVINSFILNINHSDYIIGGIFIGYANAPTLQVVLWGVTEMTTNGELNVYNLDIGRNIEELLYNWGWLVGRVVASGALENIVRTGAIIILNAANSATLGFINIGEMNQAAH